MFEVDPNHPAEAAFNEVLGLLRFEAQRRTDKRRAASATTPEAMLDWWSAEEEVLRTMERCVERLQVVARHKRAVADKS